jgi:hypothetical protein
MSYLGYYDQDTCPSESCRFEAQVLQLLRTKDDFKPGYKIIE